jgi:hypothetical protein
MAIVIAFQVDIEPPPLDLYSLLPAPVSAVGTSSQKPTAPQDANRSEETHHLKYRADSGTAVLQIQKNLQYASIEIAFYLHAADDAVTGRPRETADATSEEVAQRSQGG